MQDIPCPCVKGNMMNISLTELDGMPGADEDMKSCGSSIDAADYMMVQPMFVQGETNMYRSGQEMNYMQPTQTDMMNKSMNMPMGMQEQYGHESFTLPNFDNMFNGLKSHLPMQPYRMPIQTVSVQPIQPVTNTTYPVERFDGDNYDMFFKILLVVFLIVFIYYLVREMKL